MFKDEENELLIPRPKLIRERANDFNSLDARDFVIRYRFLKVSEFKVLEQIYFFSSFFFLNIMQNNNYKLPIFLKL